MKAAAAALRKGFAQVGQQQPVPGGQLAGHDFKEKDVVNGLQRVFEGQGEFKLRGIILRIDRLDWQPAAVGGFHNFVKQPNWINGQPGAVNVRAGSVPFGPAAAAIRLHDVGFEFNADLGLITQALPIGDGPPQGIARRNSQRFAPKEQVPHDHAGISFPAGPDLFHREHQLAVRQALQQLGSGSGDHGPIKGQGEHGNTVARAAFGVVAGQILASRQTEMIGEEGADSFVSSHRYPPENSRR